MTSWFPIDPGATGDDEIVELRVGVGEESGIIESTRAETRGGVVMEVTTEIPAEAPVIEAPTNLGPPEQQGEVAPAEPAN